MIVLSDNDVLHKLACCDLLNYLPTFLEVAPGEIFILSSCIFKLRKVLRNEPEALARLELFYKTLSIIVDDDIDSATIDVMTNVGADAGEAILAAKAISAPDTIIVTGDKRAIKAFGNLPAGQIKEALAGRILCFDELLLGMIQKHGYDQLEPNFLAGRHCDKLLGMAFGPGRNKEHAIECLTSSANELRAACAWVLTAPK